MVENLWNTDRVTALFVNQTVFYQLTLIGSERKMLTFD